MSLPPLNLVAAAWSRGWGLPDALAVITPGQSAVLDELHALGQRRRDWLGELRDVVRRAGAQGLPRATIAAALGLTDRALRRELSAEAG